MSRIDEIKKFAWNQMDAMWHNQSANKTDKMVQFSHKGYTVVNPWMDETTQRAVNPYKYYGTLKVRRYFRKAMKRIIKEARTKEEKRHEKNTK